MREPIEIRRLGPSQIGLIGEIDRSEHVAVEYTVEAGRLVSAPVDYEVPTWRRDGSGERTVAGVVEEWRPVVESGAALFGAFAGDSVLGLAIVEASFEPKMSWLAFLYVSRPYRRMGVATALWRACERVALEAGTEGMYVSAVRRGAAIGFYLSRGCELAQRPHRHLVAKAPDDIQLICPI